MASRRRIRPAMQHTHESNFGTDTASRVGPPLASRLRFWTQGAIRLGPARDRV